MLTQVYWIPLDQKGALGIMPRPRGNDWLEDELQALARSGVTFLVSLLEREEEEELGLVNERALAEAAGLTYLSLPMPDRGVPIDDAAATVVIARVAEAVSKAGRVVVHCRQGIGRAALIACGALMCLGLDVDTAISKVGNARGRQTPETEEQVRWLRDRSHIHSSSAPEVK